MILGKEERTDERQDELYAARAKVALAIEKAAEPLEQTRRCDEEREPVGKTEGTRSGDEEGSVRLPDRLLGDGRSIESRRGCRRRCRRRSCISTCANGDIRGDLSNLVPRDRL